LKPNSASILYRSCKLNSEAKNTYLKPKKKRKNKLSVEIENDPQNDEPRKNGDRRGSHRRITFAREEEQRKESESCSR
jgi:hypothetical protein